MSWYSAGTLAATKNSKTILGSGTQWVKNIRVGEAIQIGTALYQITNVASDTSLSIDPAFAEASGAGKTYRVIPFQGYVKKLADEAARLLFIVDEQVTGFEETITQELGNATDKVISQDKVTKELEWAQTVVTKTEAEAGTATTRRAWSALRVREAITGWWAGFGTSYGRGFIGLTNAEAARAKVGLVNGTEPGQNIINSVTGGLGSISYSGTLLNSTGNNNTASGKIALLNNTTGSANTATGVSALRENITGTNNTAAGADSLRENTTGSFNTATGSSALRENITGTQNTATGFRALRDNTEYNNCGGFGYDSQVTASNQIQLGDSTTTVYAYGAVQNRSDARDKAEIRDTVLGLDFINAIRPVDYKLDMREDYRVELGENPTKEQLESNKLANIQTDGTHTRKRYHHGVIAQQVAEVIEELGVDFGGFQDHSKIGGDDVLSIGYEEFIAPLIKAVQELNSKIETLEGKK